eukprot:maker-scaffold89_size390429-snap-gene-0.18 protein:Tk12445 transcript:maker-scaffold89_size390429-snap-gene-0.18-mRNA-1 annotation:"protein isoform b-like"
MVDGIMVSPTKVKELLGVRFDAKFSTAPHDINVAIAVRRRAGLIARHAHHLPSAVVPTHLQNEESKSTQIAYNAPQAAQVALNDVARTSTGKKQQGPYANLAGLPSINELVARASATTETWKAFRSSDGKMEGPVIALLRKVWTRWLSMQPIFGISPRPSGLPKRGRLHPRFMVATRDIEALEMILWEQPAVIGPYTREAQGCLQCFQKVSSPYTCQRCNLPVCDAKCQDGTLHKDNECQFFQAGVTEGGQARGTGTVPSQICVTPLRMLLKRARDPKVFAQIDMLMDHATNGKDLLTLSTLKVICMIRDQRQGTNFAQSEIQRMIGILRTNGMKLEQRGEDGTPGVALYPIYSLINHACSNNTNYVKYSDRHMELRSQVAIGKGQEIFTRYISSTLGNVRRREEIERNWFFRCQCPRCLDPTEFGTFMSAVRCFQCQSGYLLPSDAQDLESDWKCDRCEWIILHQKVNEVITTLETQ